ncbi:UDP-N-acetylglucosamine 1-carboxyvinyltransferase [Anaerolineales bacterium HSG6]|nr:UDP-N-acetylglucosamine 1-carboxyvinyltransferase [Anaerolineales bacterium HSG6]MDM8532539.1 UDP-N-acetylglucosamine 1-carboxyvinyltransferase [Anaerolineales bacterium HSG25]
MDAFLIEGKSPLNGVVTPSGNKNAAFPLISAALLTDKPIILHNLPNIGDVCTMLKIIEDLGVEVTRHDPHNVTLRAGALGKTEPDPNRFAKIRGALVLMGSLLAREGVVNLNQPGGDQIGRRRVDTHISALQALGAEFKYQGGDFVLQVEQLRGVDMLLEETSVTATENAILAAVLAEGQTIIRNAASEPHVQDLCLLLRQMGAKIQGVGSNVLTIEGVDSLGGAEYTLGPDYLEVGSFIALSAVTEGELLIKNVAPEHLRMTLMVFKRLGIEPEIRGQDLFLADNQPLVTMSDIGNAIPKIDDAPWPAFPADMMSVALVAATQATGTVLFHEKMYESRLYFVDRLISMGARIVLCDPHRALVQGPSLLRGDKQGISSPDIRAGIALLIAALCAEGKTIMHNIQQIDRGYEDIETKLLQLGAKIERIGE